MEFPCNVKDVHAFSVQMVCLFTSSLASFASASDLCMYSLKVSAKVVPVVVDDEAEAEGLYFLGAGGLLVLFFPLLVPGSLGSSSLTPSSSEPSALDLAVSSLRVI